MILPSGVQLTAMICVGVFATLFVGDNFNGPIFNGPVFVPKK